MVYPPLYPYAWILGACVRRARLWWAVEDVSWQPGHPLTTMTNAQCSGGIGLPALKSNQVEEFSYWDCIEQAYDTIVLDNPEVFEKTFAMHAPWIGDLVAAHWLCSEVDNGGFTQFFDNPTGVLAPEAHASLLRMGMPQIACLLDQAMALIPGGYERDQQIRQARLQLLVKHQDDSDALDSERHFEALDNAFFESDEYEEYWERLDAYALANKSDQN